MMTRNPLSDFDGVVRPIVEVVILKPTCRQKGLTKYDVIRFFVPMNWDQEGHKVWTVRILRKAIAVLAKRNVLSRNCAKGESFLEVKTSELLLFL